LPGHCCLPQVITHRRAGQHLPGDDPRRHRHRSSVAAAMATEGSVGWPRPAPPFKTEGGESLVTSEESHTPSGVSDCGTWNLPADQNIASVPDRQRARLGHRLGS
jgi:hypothetical protein